MGFRSGRVSFARFYVNGDTPPTVDETVLSTLNEFKFAEQEIGAPEETEAGFTTGEHIFDTQFNYEKNGFGNVLLFALRIDTNKVPSDIKKAYKVMNEQAMAGQNPSGFASKTQKREANDLASQQVREELASGKFRRSKVVEVMWDLSSNHLYCGATGSSVAEQLALRMYQAFNVEVSPMSSGGVAVELARSSDKGREFEDVRPAAFTAPPPEARQDAEDADGPRNLEIPSVPWAAGNYEMKDFLGNEFLLWLWYMQENHEGLIEITDAQNRKAEIAITIDKSLDMDCAWGVRGKQSLRGDGPTRLPEAGRALAMGKWPRKMGLIMAEAEGGEGRQWELTLQGDQFAIGSAALPDVEEAENPRQITEGRVLNTLGLADTLDRMMATYLNYRFDTGWSTRRQKVRDWIAERTKA